jgi:hypothetical protein
MGAALVLEMAAAVPDKKKLSAKPKLLPLFLDILTTCKSKKQTIDLFGCYSPRKCTIDKMS